MAKRRLLADSSPLRLRCLSIKVVFHQNLLLLFRFLAVFDRHCLIGIVQPQSLLNVLIRGIALPLNDDGNIVVLAAIGADVTPRVNIAIAVRCDTIMAAATAAILEWADGTCTSEEVTVTVAAALVKLAKVLRTDLELVLVRVAVVVDRWSIFVLTFPAIHIPDYEGLANFLVSFFHTLLRVTFLQNPTEVGQPRVGLPLVNLDPILVDAGVLGIRIAVMAKGTGESETILTNRSDLSLSLLLINGHLHLVRPKDFNAKQHRSTLLGLEDSRLIGWNVQDTLVAG